MSVTCRLCLKKVNSSECVVVSGNFDSFALMLKINTCLPEINMGLIKTSAVCTPCLDDLSRSYDFKCRSLRSQQLILDFMMNSGNKCLESLDDLNADKLSQTPTTDDNASSWVTADEPDNDVILLKTEMCNTEPVPMKNEEYSAEVKTLTEFCKVEPEESILETYLNDCPTAKPFSVEYDTIESTSAKMEPPEVSLSLEDCLANTNDEEYECDGSEPDERPFKCKFCPKSYKTLHHLRQHVRLHYADKPFRCHACSYRCWREGDLRVHLTTHSVEKPFGCDVCDFKCATKNGLKQHVRGHTDKDLFRCEACPKRFKRKQYLKQHMRTHSLEKQLRCKLCDFRCLWRSELKEHAWTHMRERPFKCDLCGYGSLRRSDLKLHMARHTGEKPFECDVCDYRGPTKVNMRLHVRKHINERPFRCDVCDSAFKTKASMNRHVKVHLKKQKANKV